MARELTTEEACIHFQKRAHMHYADGAAHLQNGMPLRVERSQRNAAFCYREMWAYLAELIGVDND